MNNLIFSDEMPPIDWSEVKRFEMEFGLKGATSLTLPRAWTPPFSLVSVAQTEEIRARGSVSEVLGDAAVGRIASLAGSRNEIIIRSSVVDESIWDRGTYYSATVDCSRDDFETALNSATKKVIESGQNQQIGLMIQRFIKPASHGEFGNLQRISKTRDQWEVSTVELAGSTTKQRLNSQRDQAADPLLPLAVKSGMARERLFGGIGAWLNNELLLGRSQRLNCEWITDNKDFYLVQIDEEDEDLSGVNPFQVRIPSASQPACHSGRFLKLAEGDTLKNWDKLQVLNELWEADALHKPVLFFVCLADLPSDSDADGISALEIDFADLIGPAGIIVRTSVAAGVNKIPNLPRTECLTPSDAVRWCVATAKELVTANDVKKLAFVAHRFVAARASAWVRAEPSKPIVEINALWGLPDALQYCPYDIWEVHVPTGVATDYPDYKSDMLISKPDGSWDYVRIKNELARSNSIGSPEAKDLAARSLAIAERLGRACHIMWFVGCADIDGSSFNLPWYWTEAHPSERNADRLAYKIFTVSNEETLKEFIEWKGQRTRQALALRPNDLNLMRNTGFIEAVGKAAQAADVPVILSGSTLAHAYYQLRKVGCSVVTPSEKEHSRIRRTAAPGKLVRDKIPAKIAERREVEVTRKIPTDLIKGFLISKLFEEALEVREAQGVEQKTEELADLFEVYRAIAKAEGISLTAIKKAADQKRRKSGGFEEGLVLLQTGIASSKRSSSSDVERNVGDVIADLISENSAEIPFSFFGFMRMDRPRTILFEEFGIRLEILLRPDRIELRLAKGTEQLNLLIN